MDVMVECSVCVNHITLFYDSNIIQSKHPSQECDITANSQ